MNTCCFLGHREINESKELRQTVYETVKSLITDKGVDTFLFGSKSRFDSLCLEIVTQLKEKYSHIKRIYVRAEYPYINDSYRKYLLRSYDDTYFPEKLLRAGKAVYVERNYEMIDKSYFCMIYYDSSYSPSTRKSGTKIALDYAVAHKKRIIIFP